MKIDVLTLFPEMFEPIRHSILARAEDKGLIEINIINFRDFSASRHKKVDDIVYGGGAGMLLAAQPIYDAINSIDPQHSALRIYLSPRGDMLTNTVARQIASTESNHIILLCGHYEGVDERVIELCIDRQICIGEYVLTGGELPAMVLIDAVSRFVDGVIAKDSLENDSFENGRIEHPQYTRPAEFMGLKVPDVLLNGNHKMIDKWRDENSKKIKK